MVIFRFKSFTLFFVVVFFFVFVFFCSFCSIFKHMISFLTHKNYTFTQNRFQFEFLNFNFSYALTHYSIKFLFVLENENKNSKKKMLLEKPPIKTNKQFQISFELCLLFPFQMMISTCLPHFYLYRILESYDHRC